MDGLPADTAELLVTPVRRLLRRDPVTCDPATSIAEAAARMEAAGVGSIVVVAGDGTPVGIVTDRDLRARVVAAGRRPGDPVQAVMTRPLHTIQADETAGEALVRMLRHRIHHLPVLASATARGVVPGPSRLLGVVSARDFLAFRQVHPLRLLREIEEQVDVGGLASAAAQVHDVVAFLDQDGISPAPMCQLISELHDAVARRALAMAEAEAVESGVHTPDVDWCWLALGSEGRREQTLRTDQDNALVYVDDGRLPARGLRRLEHLTRRAAEILELCGIPRCGAGIMASESAWRRSEAGWMQVVADARRDPYGQRFLQAAALLDARPVAGNLELGRGLVQRVRDQLASDTVFLRRLAAEATRVAVPLAPWGCVVTPWWGRYRGRLAIKLRALNPLVAGVRVFAAQHRLDTTNTLDRLEALLRTGVLGRMGPTADLPQAFETLLGFRIALDLERLAASASSRPHRRLKPAPADGLRVRPLSPAQKAALASALGAVKALQETLRQAFVV